MATLHPPFNELSLGQHDIQASLLGWHTVGSCTVTVNEPFHFAASGSYNALGHKGTFDMRLDITDEDAAATTGPCTITNAGQTLSGTYTRTGAQISFSARDHSLTASFDGQNVILQVSGYPKVRVLA